MVSLVFSNKASLCTREEDPSQQPLVRFKENSALRGFVFYTENESARLALIAAEQSGALNRLVRKHLGQSNQNMGYFDFFQSEEDGAFRLQERSFPCAHTPSLSKG